MAVFGTLVNVSWHLLRELELHENASDKALERIFVTDLFANFIRESQEYTVELAHQGHLRTRLG